MSKKDLFIGATVALVASWAYRKYNVGEIVSPLVEPVKDFFKTKLDNLRNKRCTAEKESN